ncbi:proline-rich domain-containing protein [Tsukamurella paurometabola]|uniref:DUF7847 domain-containing protein n=1 Tax=Tsukamurella paurometabola (strain ATCC 8368 / DSM 20162 / CCUG 35730 / CIP 100753 / JCM 10117 / KCTC 9821 / NBRC 16120 / NCIMB 702349 / NCTC 13040) TaxID=521096 RepID=D5UXH8_TSUPD|nr:proline-rich domain-containing protein [Tsukamurella paurometabola]ADG78070.1 conserved hypothetical protein [Tsukamurella paurometabola DSM 20162]SUP30037.1 Uncharacterised protein [Tsukamurella paurometabola]
MSNNDGSPDPGRHEQTGSSNEVQQDGAQWPHHPGAESHAGYPASGPVPPQPGYPHAEYRGYLPQGFPNPSQGSPQSGHGAPSGYQAGYPQPRQVPPGYGQPGYPPSYYGWGAPSAPEPGSIPLRPLNVGEIYNGAFAAIRANPGVMIGFTAIIVVVSQVLTFLAQIPLTAVSVDTGSDDDSAILANSMASLAVSLGMSLITALATTILTGMLTVVVARSVLGDRTDAGSAWRALKPRLWPLIGLVVIQGLIYLVPTMLLIAMLVLVLGGSWAAAAILAVLGLVLVFVVMLGLMPAFALATAAVVLEGRGPIDSLRRGFQLQRPGYWRLLGILVLTYLITSIVAGIIAIPFSVGTIFSAGDGSLDNITGSSVLGLGLTAIAGVIGSIITMPFLSAVQTLLYTDQRMRTERFDLVLQSASVHQTQTGIPIGPAVWMPQRPL